MFTPQNVKKLTNVAVVSLKKDGTVFELALYPNKMHDYRNKLTTDLNLILHTLEIYKAVEKGTLASKKDLERCFPKMNRNEIMEYILDHGKEKMSEKTRLYILSNKEKEIISIIQKKIVKVNGKFLLYNEIKDLMSKHAISVDIRKESKVQANRIIALILRDENYRRSLMSFRVPKESSQILGSSYEFERFQSYLLVKIECDQFKDFKVFCELNNIQYDMVDEEKDDSEEIC